MEILKEIKKIKTGENRPIDVWYYLQGMYRYRLYYSNLGKKLIRTHIREQIDYRIKVMNPICYNNGTCIHCGCMTTALQMCNKICGGKCYPYMMNKNNWKNYKKNFFKNI